MAILLSLCACLGWGTADFIGGLKSRHLPPLAVMIAATPFAILVIGTIVLLRGLPLPLEPALFWASVSGLVGVVALYLLYKGLSAGPMSIVAPISGTGVILPVVAGIFQGDSLSGLQRLGITAAIIGTFLAAKEKKESGSSANLVQGLNYALASAVAIGLYFIFMDWASEVDPYWASLIMRVSYGLVLLPILLLTRTSVRGTGPHLLPIAAMGTIDALGAFSFALASTLGMISVVSVVSALYPGVTVLLSGLLLRERVRKIQAVGVVLALVGIVLISAG